MSCPALIAAQLRPPRCCYPPSIEKTPPALMLLLYVHAAAAMLLLMLLLMLLRLCLDQVGVDVSDAGGRGGRCAAGRDDAGLAACPELQCPAKRAGRAR